MLEWKLIRLGDICKTNENSYYPKDNWKFVNYLDTGSLTENKITELQYINTKTDKMPSRARRKVIKNSILYSTVRPNQLHYGIIKEPVDNLLVSTGFTVIDVDTNKAIPEFIYYLLIQNNTTEQLQAIAEQSVSTYPSIKPSDIENLEFKLPNLIIQSKIVSILDTVDSKICQNEKINNNLLEQASTLFNSAIQQSTSVVYAELGSLAEVKGGKRLPKGVNLVTTPNQHPYIRVRDLNNAVFASLSNDYEYVDDETQQSISRYIVSTGDLLISIVGTIGLTAIVDHTLNKANLTENCVKLTNLKNVTPEYLLLFLRSSQGVEAISKGTVGAVQLKLPIKNIQSIAVPLLCDEDLLPLNETLSAIFSQISANIVEMKQLADIRDTLLPKLMSGELDVSDIDL